MSNSGKKYAVSRLPGWPAWTGFSGKTLWKWMEMLAIPLMLVILSGVISNQQAVAAEQQHLNDNKIAQDNRATDRQIANDQQEQTTLDNYMTRMSDLLLNTNVSTRLHDSRDGDEIRNVARAITLTTLDKLRDPERKRAVATFLYQSDLITNKHVPGTPGYDFPIINMTYADLTKADLGGMYLQNSSLHDMYLMNADLHNAILIDAFLKSSDLQGAILRGADLQKADLRGADLSNTDLQDADLHNANLSGANLNNARLKGTIMPDGSKHS